MQFVDMLPQFSLIKTNVHYRPACHSTLFQAWETFLQEIEADSVSSSDVAGALSRQVIWLMSANIIWQTKIRKLFLWKKFVFIQLCFSRCHGHCSRKRFTRKFKVGKYLLTENLLILLFQRLKKNYQRWVLLCYTAMPIRWLVFNKIIRWMFSYFEHLMLHQIWSNSWNVTSQRYTRHYFNVLQALAFVHHYLCRMLLNCYKVCRIPLKGFREIVVLLTITKHHRLLLQNGRIDLYFS